MDDPIGSPARAAIYARVSTAQQVDGTSLDEQVDRCNAWARAHGLTVVTEYRESGVSGATTSRPELDRLLAAARRGEIDTIVVFALDRWGRSMRDLLVTLDQLDKLGVTFASVRESIDSSTPTGRLMRNIIGSLAEYERELILDRTLRGRDAAARAGGWPGGPAPFGFRLVRGPNDQHTTLEIDDQQVTVIHEIVRLLLDERLSTVEASRELNARGLEPPRGGRWTPEKLRRLLTRANGWDGRYTFRRRRHDEEFAAPSITIPVPPILTAERMAAFEARVAETTTVREPSAGNRDYLLARRLSFPCGGSGAGVYRQDRNLRQYLCMQSRAPIYLRDGVQCDCRRVNADIVEAVVWAQVAEVLLQPERLLSYARQALGSTAEGMSQQWDDLATLDRRITRLESAIGSQVADLLKQGLDARVIQSATTELEADLLRLRHHRKRIVAWAEAQKTESDQARKLEAFAAQAAKSLSDTSPRARRRIIDLLDINVRITDWVTCHTCNGTGVVPKAELPGKRGCQVDNCPDCQRHRFIPVIETSGVVSPVATEADTADPLEAPFTLRSAG